MIKKYQLDFQKAEKYFKENLKGTNKLSDSVISFLNFESGSFFALLPEEAAMENINEFKVGGKTSCLRNDVGELIYKLLNLDANISCVFDDFNSDEGNVKDDSLFASNGLRYGDEIYYLIGRNAKPDLVIQCLQRSNVIWHSLCILSDIRFEENVKKINENDINKICLNAKLIIIGAYDAESYIIWEKK